MAAAAPEFDGVLFYAEFIHSAQIIKTIAQTLEAASVPEATFIINRDGMYMVEFDPASTVLLEVWLPKVLFRPYFYSDADNDLRLKIQVKTLCSQLTSISKKNSMVFKILDEKPTNLIFQIHDRSKPHRAEEREIIGQFAADDFTVPDVPSSEGYPCQVPIESSFFGKVKKNLSSSKILTVEVVGSNFISFASEIEGVSSSRINSGIVTSADDPVYTATFRSDNFNQLSKLASMSLPMKVAAPEDPTFPLRIDCVIGDSGRISAFVKNTETIDLEAEHRRAELATEQAVLSEAPPKRTRKKAT